MGVGLRETAAREDPTPPIAQHREGGAQRMIDVLEVDQWTSTGNIRSHTWATLKEHGIASVEGGDSIAIRQIFGGHFRFITVSEHESPSLGHVWFTEGPDGRPIVYRENCDSSD